MPMKTTIAKKVSSKVELVKLENAAPGFLTFTIEKELNTSIGLTTFETIIDFIIWSNKAIISNVRMNLNL